MAVGRENSSGDGQASGALKFGPWSISRGKRFRIQYRGHNVGHFDLKEGNPIFLLRTIYTLSESELGQLMDRYPGRQVVAVINGQEMDEEGPGEFVLPVCRVYQPGEV